MVVVVVVVVVLAVVEVVDGGVYGWVGGDGHPVNSVVALFFFYKLKEGRP